ncbi:hypothetical protein KO527_22400 [Pseudoalteromonas sp. C2R02]|uniref:hypothetical protein n=1 Tax=Pseudoalteromonas sp. C2R02 TaxID=2841565 RepID=UPI001C088028|nr:hypothetical protein [Pseudoalteromonas sp. C2R02]MBU2972092.1 hypothetical protein [Pseudoalteromonas sp. C2R02]
MERLGAVRDLLRAAKKQLSMSLHQKINALKAQTDVGSFVYRIDDHSFFTDDIDTHFKFPAPQQAFKNGAAPLSNPGNGAAPRHRSFITSIGDQQYLDSKVITTTMTMDIVLTKMKTWNNQSHMLARYSQGNKPTPIYILSKDGFIIKTTFGQSFKRWQSIEAVNE